MMGENTVIAPGYHIYLNGKELNLELSNAVMGVTFDDELNLPSTFNIKFNMVDFKKSDWRGVKLDLFKPGDTLKLTMGTDKFQEMVNGEITNLNLNFDNSSMMEIRGYDRMRRLCNGAKRRSFKDMKDSDLVSMIASEAGLAAQVDDTNVIQPYIFQNNQSNYHFLLERAKRLGYEMMVRDKTLIFRKPQEDKAAKYKLEYGITLNRFAVELKTLAEGSEVEVRGWDVKNKKEIVSKAGSGSETSVMKGKESGYQMAVRAFGKSAIAIVDETVINASEADQLAKAKYNINLKEFITAEGECTGMPGLRAGETIEVKGLGVRFSGVYYLVSTSHTINDEGYITTFRGKRTGI